MWMPALVFEFTLAGWLLVKGAAPAQDRARLRHESGAFTRRTRGPTPSDLMSRNRSCRCRGSAPSARARSPAARRSRASPASRAASQAPPRCACAFRDQHQLLAALRVGYGHDRVRASGHTFATNSSTAPSGTISPATLANRFARPLMVTNPSASMSTMSPVSYQPSVRRLEHAWASRRAGSRASRWARARRGAPPSAMPVDRLQPMLNARQQAAHRARA